MAPTIKRGRSLLERSQRIWRAIAGAGHRGIVTQALRERFEGAIAEEAIESALQSLVRGGYIERIGEHRYGCWVINADCRVPVGEVAPAWLTDNDDDESPAPSASKDAACPRPPVPSSVFNLGATLADSPLGKKTATPKQQASALQVRSSVIRFKKGTEAAAPALGWTAPESAGVASEVVEPADSPTPDSAPPAIPFVGELDIDAADRAAAVAAGRPAPGEFLCALYSNGVLDIESRGQRLRLTLDHTRRLLHYLDHLRGDELIEEVLGELK